MQPWPQNYAPLGGFSAPVAAVPVVLLLGLLAFGHVRAHRAALVALLAALMLAIGVYGMPAKLALGATGFGAAFGLFPIGWLVLNAIFIYQLSVETGGFVVVQRQIAGLSGDRRIQALLIAFSFGAFIEGVAGFGAPVAIAGALLIGLGFTPLEAAKLALIGNTAPVAFGSLGLPVTTLASVTGLDVHMLSAMVGRQLPVFSLVIPFWLVAAHAGWRGMLAVWPACLAAGASFATVQFLVSNFHGPWLVDLASALASLAALLVLLRCWRPRDAPAAGITTGLPPPPARAGAGLRAWLPWIFLTAFVFVSALPPVRDGLNQIFAPKLAVPALHLGLQRMPPIVKAPELEKAEFTFNALSATGTALFVAGVAAGLCLGLRPRALAALYARTVWRVRVSLLTIALMLAIGYTTRYSGVDATLGLALAATGGLFPFFSPLLGWLGVALTGSDTASNVLFGNLQRVTAEQLHLPPVLTAAANSAGGVMGKMIDAQSIVVASTATGGAGGGDGKGGQAASTGAILRAVFWHSLALALLMGVLVWLQAKVFPGVIPVR